MNTLWKGSLLIFTLSALVYAYTQWYSSNTKPQNIIDNELTPDFIAESLKSTLYDEKGKLSHIIEADRMEHYTDLALSNFESPNYTLYPKDGSSEWHINAKEATLYKDNKVILKNNVVISTQEENSLVHEIQGKTLELDINTNIITSEQHIYILGRNFKMSGSGLIVDLNTTQMTLKNHEQTIYQNPNG